MSRKCLIVEDDPFWAATIAEALPSDWRYSKTESAMEALEFLATGEFDLVTLDLSLGSDRNRRGFRLLAEMRRKHYDVRVIIISVTDDYADAQYLINNYQGMFVGLQQKATFDELEFLRTVETAEKLQSIEELAVPIDSTIHSSSLPTIGERIRVFLGSSSEMRNTALLIHKGLHRDISWRPWFSGVFGLGSTNIESLVRVAGEVNAAVLIVSPDDLVERRTSQLHAPRDNVIFELGLFVGALGRENTIIVSVDNGEGFAVLPTDLDGVVIIRMKVDDLPNEVIAACTSLREHLGTIGIA